MPKKSLTIILVLLSFLAHAQEKSVTIKDIYKGYIAATGDDYANTVLTLQHEKATDMGTFTLEEIFQGSKYSKPAAILTAGDWTVLKGSASDKNARVIELNAQGGRILYFMRLKNGNVQQLDFGLHEMIPAAKHTLRKH